MENKMSNTTKIIWTLIGLALGALILYSIGVIELLALKGELVAVICAVAIVAAYQVHVARPLNKDGKLISSKTSFTEEAEVEHTQKALKEFLAEEDFADKNISKKINDHESVIVPYVGNIHGENLENKKQDYDGSVPIDRLHETIKEESKKPKRKPSKSRTKKTVTDGK
jgi:hypothetical protein